MISELTKEGINGSPNIPGDKSISHRSIIIPSISKGVCEVNNILRSEDVLHTINAFKSMGVKIIETNPELEENTAIQRLWKNYKHRIHKKRATYTLNF